MMNKLNTRRMILVSSSLLILGMSSSPSYSQSLQQQLKQQSSQQQRDQENCQVIVRNAQYKYNHLDPDEQETLKYVDPNGSVHESYRSNYGGGWSDYRCKTFLGKVGETKRYPSDRCIQSSCNQYGCPDPKQYIGVKEYQISGDKLIEYNQSIYINCRTREEEKGGISTNEYIKFK